MSKLFTLAYIECALWSSCDEGGTPLDRGYDVSDIHPDTLAAMAKDCADFLEMESRDGRTAAEMVPCNSRGGHDFWLTRNGHGAGFWDRPDVYGKDEAEELSSLARGMGSVDLYVGDDGMIHGGV